METELSLIARRARENKRWKFSNLMYMINERTLTDCYRMLKKNKAPGIDKLTVREYGTKLSENIKELVRKLKAMSYKPLPSRRVYIPKGNGKKRPLGIPAVEDKLVQIAMSRIMCAIFEQDFLETSFGSRKHKSCHHALKELNSQIMSNRVSIIVEADIKGFFDNVDFELLMKCVEMRITDKRFLKYIMKFLKSGIVEENVFKVTEKGTPQGGVISPILANIFLHYVVDKWLEVRLRKEVSGYIGIVRYVDDFVILLEHVREAEPVLEKVKARLRESRLEVSEEKTRIVRFNRYPKKGEETLNGTFSFLGFTHYIGKSRNGKPRVKRRTEKKRLAKALKGVRDYLKKNRTKKIRQLWRTLKQKMVGHYNYYGITDNYRRINLFRDKVVKLIYKWLNRRSQKKS